MSADPLEPTAGAEKTGELIPAQDHELLSQQLFATRGLNGRGMSDDDEEGGGLDFRRYIAAVLSRAWMLAVAFVVGLGGAYFVWNGTELQYTAEGSLWIEVVRRNPNPGDVSPIQQSGLLESNAWIELLRSYSVLDPVVVKERLYLEGIEEYQQLFASFELADRFQPGDYLLTRGSDNTWMLATGQGNLVDQAQPGELLGEAVGFEWIAPTGAQLPEDGLPFSVLHPRDASRSLAIDIQTRMDLAGNFIRLSLVGTDPEKVASILQSVMDQHVQVAAELSRLKLEEASEVLEEQLIYAEEGLAAAETDLESFRVNTITLPTDDEAPNAPGTMETRTPAITQFFNMQMNLETVRNDRVRLEQVLDSMESGPVPVAALELIPGASGSRELNAALVELVSLRSQLRLLRDRYTDEHQPIKDLLASIRTLEEMTIPQITRGILREVRFQENQLQARVDSASAELQQIPPRMIEESRLRRKVAIQDVLYNQLESRVQTARLAAASSIPDVRVLDEVAVPTVPTGGSRLPLTMMALLGPLGLAVVGALLLDHVDSRLRYPTEISNDMGLDILASIPRISDEADDNTNQVVESFRELRLTTDFAYGGAGPMMLTITSPSKGDGKSLVSANLAVAFAEVGRRTLLIDGDTRRGDVHRLLGAQRTPGLTDYLRDRSSGEIIQATDYEHLSFIGSGTRAQYTPELLASRRMASFMAALKKAYEVIIIDSPPLAAGGDPFLLATLTGHMALVVRTGATEKALTLSKLEAMARFPVRILGAVLNDVQAGSAYGYYYEPYLAGYEALDEPGTETAVGESRQALLTGTAREGD